MQPLSFEEIYPAIEAESIDFLFANPSYFACAELQYELQAILSITNRVMGFPLEQFGGVIVRSAFRPEIKSTEDINNRIFEAVSWSSLGGYQMAWSELTRKGLSPLFSPSELRFGKTHTHVIEDVVNGVVDVGTVRTDTIVPGVAIGRTEACKF